MKKGKYSIVKRFWAMVITLAMILGMVPVAGFAATGSTASAVVNKVADPGTINTYKDLLGAFADGNRYAGRIWTDKSVLGDQAALEAALGQELTAQQLQNLQFGSDEFMLVYSALGSTTSVYTEQTVSSNLDVVIVLDNSRSMTSNVTDADGNYVTRLQAVVGAANKLIDGILENPSNRLALVAYSANSSMLLDLDRYAQTDTCLTNSSGQLSAQADSLTDQTTDMKGYSITAHQTGTNVQSGINEAMKILNNAQNTQGRTPVVIVMTDGAANYAAYQNMLGDTSTGGNYKQPNGSNTTAEVVLSTLLNAAYWKYTVSQKYGTSMRAYTVGVDIGDLDDASIVVNPGDFFNATSTTGFSSVALNMLELYTEWSESSTAVNGVTSGGNRNSYTWTFPQPASAAIKEGIENNIVYADKYYEVDSEGLATAFDDILTSISSLQDAFQVIEKTEITNGESSMAYVDFIGDYMELKSFKGISLYGEFYAVEYKSSSTANNGNGTVTVTYVYKVAGNHPVTDPLSGEVFNLEDNVFIDVKHTYNVDANGNRTSAGEQDLWIHIDEQVLPLVYHKISTENGVTTYTIYDEVPVRFYYTVGVSEYVAPAGNLLLHRIDEAYLAANTGTDGVVYFYANQYYAQDDDETLVNHTKESGHGDAHTAVTPDATNRYYVHQYNLPIFTNIVDGSGNTITMNPDTYGVVYDASYVTTIMTYADLASLSSTTPLYTSVHFHAPTGSQTGTTSDGGVVYAGGEKTYYVFSDWGHLLEDMVFFDTVNGVYINADGTTSDKGVWNANYTNDQYLEAVAAYLAATPGVTATDLHAYMAIGSWRIQRFANRTFAKTENPTDTASLRIAPVLNSDDATDHEGSIVIWLGNNGRIGYTAQTPKTVTNAGGDDIDGQLVVIGDVLTYTITATNYEDAPATIVITDYVPSGTEYVAGSADNNGVIDGDKLTWTILNVPVGETVKVSYQVKVTGKDMTIIENTAYITIGNNPSYETNTTENPPVGKLSSSDDYSVNGEVQVGDFLTYTIYYHNNTDAATMVTISDVIPAGTTYVDGSASYSGTSALTLTTDASDVVTKLTWAIAQVPVGESGSVHFQVMINSSAVTPVENTAQIQVGDNSPVILTNKVTDDLAYGNLTLNKLVATGNAVGDNDKYFTLVLQSGIPGVDILNGTFQVTGSSAQTEVTFTNGYAELQIKHAESITVVGLPAGITVTVYEKEQPGYSAVYSADAATIVANETAAITVTNTYNVTPVSVRLEGTKNLTGLHLEANAFSFLVLDANGDVAAGGVNNADGSITFDTITYAAAGVYTYTVKEVAAGAAGFTYDATVYTVTVTVTDDGNGVLTASVEYPTGGLVFNNTYTPEGVHVTLGGNKVLTGEAADGIVDGEYSFDVYEYDFATSTVGQLVSGGTTTAGTTSAAIMFAPIGFTLQDLTDAGGNILSSKDFYFLVEEDIPAANGPTFDPNMYYDTTKYLAKVTVTYDAVLGILAVSATEYMTLAGVPVAGITFTNVQNPSSVEVTPVGNKTTTNAPAGISFSFSVINVATGTEAGVGVGDANGSITFSTLSFSEPGTYVYTIQEANAGNTTNGITYDSAVYTMTVVVTRDATNKLVATVTYTDAANNQVTAPAFHNAYNAAGHINIIARKQLTGRDLNAGEFAFKLVRQDNGGEIDGIVAADGTITFATMYYSLADIPAGQNKATIHYVMSEVVPDVAKLPGVTYDTSEYDVYITIVDNGGGTISAYLSDAAGNALSNATNTGITFTNSYTVTTGTQVNIQVEKDLTGRDLEEGEFEFALFRYDNVNGWKNVASTLNAADGTVSFLRTYNASTLGQLAFAADDTYTVLYRIDEVNNHLGGVTYDTKSIYVKVVIRHDVANASYSVDFVRYYSDEACTNELTAPAFENIYKPAGTSVTIDATKQLTGRPLEAGEFSFVIKDYNGEVVSYGHMDANGHIAFSAISFSAAGEYTFTMQEVAGSLGGVSYDANVYTFTVDVVDNGDGDLVATVNEPTGGFVFRNTYNPSAVSVQPSAVKILEGKVLANGEFVFVLTDGAGNEIEVATNDASGNVIFSKITYTEAGTYYYRLYERAGTDSRYTYSSTVYEITVVVTDDGDGSLYASYHIYREGVEVGAATFYNTFTPESIRLDLNDQIDIEKTVEDAANTGFSPAGFQFQVYDWNGTLVATGVSDANGYIDLEDDLVFTAAGEYSYRIVEVNTDKTGVIYDETVWVVNVTVSYDNVAGQLSISNVTYHKYGRAAGEDNSITFVNTYAPTTAEAIITLNKVLTGRDLVAGEFTFQLLENGVVIAETTNDASGNVVFTLTYDKAGVYTYTVVEVNGNKGGIAYDTSVHTVTVTVTNDPANGKLVADVQITDGTFENIYTAESVDVTLTARKIMEGRMLLAGEFTFIVTDANGNILEALNAADGTVTFEKLTYTEAGVYVYTIHEKAESLGGVTYSTRVYTATVTVTDNLEGQLVASVVYTYLDSNGVEQTIAEPLFRNVYKATEAEITLKAHKDLEGRDLAAGEFTFVLTDSEGNTLEATNAADGSITFEKLSFASAGIYVYTIHEKAESLGGVTYSDMVYTATVTVTDRLDGSMEVTVAYTYTDPAGVEHTISEPLFLNTYEGADVSVTLKAKKELEGRELEAGEFTFVLTDAKGNILEAENAANGSIVFEELTFTEAGVYVYTIHEKAESLNGVTYSSRVYTATVTVTDNLKGNLEATVVYSYTDSNGATQTIAEPLFTNVYKASSGEIVLQAEKVLLGRELKGGEFVFVLTDENGNTLETMNAADGTILFDALTFTEAGVYVYTIHEKANGLGGVTYSTRIYTATVTVIDNMNGKLEASVVYSYEDDNGATQTIAEPLFLNTYEASDAEIILKAQKSLVGRELKAGEFTFVLTDAAGNTQEVANAANGAVAFNKLTFAEAGTYVYTIHEKLGNLDGVTYTTRVYTATVTVTDNLNGGLVASVVYSYADANGSQQTIAEPVFTNVYKASDAEIILEAQKSLTGRTLMAGEFTFVLVDEAGNTIEAVNAADGSIIFENLVFTEAGTYVYTIHEKAGDLKGMTYSTVQYTATVTVTDNFNGKLEATVVYSYEDANGNQQIVAEPLFVNVYEAASVQTVIRAQKALTGRELRAGEFTFVLTDEYGNTMEAVNDADGAIAFPRLTFTEAGTYVYTIHEKQGSVGGVVYSRAVYTATVTVIDDLNGRLMVNVTYSYEDRYGAQQDARVAAFVNHYDPADAEVALEAQKYLEGRELNAGEFSFVIKDHNGEVVSYGHMDANGHIAFSAISFSAAGEYTFTMQEVAGSLGGVSYDANVYTFTVDVVDNGDGDLVATVNEPTGGFVFRNTYNPSAVSVQPSAVKILEGKVLANGEFVFVLTDGAGNEIEVATNDASGNVIFSKITYTEAGTYYYRLYERAGTDSRYTYSSTVYEITVVVTDDGDGSLYASYHIYREGVEVGAATFYNTFTPESIRLDLNDQIDIEKTVEDAANTGFSPAGFQFQVYDWNGTLVATGVSDANGYIDLEDDLVFTAAGEYSYRIVEVNTDKTGVIYDETVWVVNVTVSYDNVAGQLSISNVTYHKYGRAAGEDNSITFVNTYAPTTAEAIITLNKVLTGRDLVAGEFTFQLLENGVVIAETTNDASGNVVFTLTYDKAGVYTYTVVEVNGNKGGIAYDTSVHTVTVTVTNDPANGKLVADVQITDGTFENIYTAESVDVTLTARKIMEGRMLLAGEFTFIVTDANGNILEALNAADGTVTFEKLTYTEAGVYVYTIHEKAESLGGVTYSTRVYTATVTVTDNLEGQLVASVVYTYLDSNGVEQTIAEPLFRNVYKATEAEITLKAHKDLEGRDLAAGEFTFVLTDSEGNTLEATNAADGSITFEKLSFASAGTYTFTMAETKGEDATVRYDENVYTICITVIDDGAGQLKVESITVNGQQIIFADDVVNTGIWFVNTVDKVPETGDSFASLAIWAMTASFSALVVLLLAEKKRRAN